MAKAVKTTLVRLQEIIRRQDPPQWGSAYDPAIRATREEAPARSRPSQVWVNKLGRYCHTLSQPERKALLLALLYQGLFEIQEQKVLFPEARPHPLAGHPSVLGLSLPGLRGTIDVCDRLDMIGRHPWISAPHPEGIGKIPIPVPFVGDFLLFLSDDAGPYCVNWTIKGVDGDFERRPMRSRPTRNAEAEASAVMSRHAIEERYYLDAGIPTVRIVNADIPETLAQNLLSLLLMVGRPTINVDAVIYSELCDRLNAALRTGQPPLEILVSMVHQHGLAFNLCKSLFARAIQRRDVHAELMDEVIMIDRPLRPERRDPLQVFGAWFARLSR